MTDPTSDDTTEASMSTDMGRRPTVATGGEEASVVPAGVPDDLSGSQAPMPTERTIRQRGSLPVQAVRFAAVSVRMLRMIRRSHG